MSTWIGDAFVYHIFPLGAFGAPWINPGGDPVPRIRQLADWVEPASRIGANTLLLGPLWESGTHGYDTHDYSIPDRRLGNEHDLAEALGVWKSRGFRLVFDGVFNHCGRGFAAFADLVLRGRDSAHVDWFSGVDFSRRSPYGDPFHYDGWNGHHNLVKFNLRHPAVREYLFSVVEHWIDCYDLDGLRLDAADVMDHDFLTELSRFCKAKKPDFWLLGEVVHGDYNAWAPGAGLDSVTNYELFKGLWSSHNDANYHEVAWTLNRQFGPDGLYRGRRHFTFGDNHDVDRVASTLKDPSHLYPHAILSATVPGIPSVYYGSEAGMGGRKTPTGDEPLRPALSPTDVDRLPHQPLRDVWARLASIRARVPVLRDGDYTQALVASREFAFWRHSGSGSGALVAVNSSSQAEAVSVSLPGETPNGPWVDLLNPGESFEPQAGHLVLPLPPNWGRILVPSSDCPSVTIRV